MLLHGAIKGGTLLLNGLAAGIGMYVAGSRRRQPIRLIKRTFPVDIARAEAEAIAEGQAATVAQSIQDDGEQVILLPRMGLAKTKLQFSYAAIVLGGAGSLLALPSLYAWSGFLTAFWFGPAFAESFERSVQRRTVRFGSILGAWSGLTLVLGHNVAAATGMSIYLSSRSAMTTTQRQARRLLAAVLAYPKTTAWIINDGIELEVPISSLSNDHVIVVKQGGIVPVDGIVVSGTAMVFRHTVVAGAGRPVEKNEGDAVLASAAVESGEIHLRKTDLD